MLNHYEVLGVPATASTDDIKAAYYAKARRYHPDAHAGSPVGLLEEAEREMQDLNAAWVVLRSPRTRATYDRALKRSAARRSRPPGQPAARHKGEPVAALTIGRGFRMWMGSCGATAGRDGVTKMSLALDGATDLAPLAALAPAGLHALHAQGSAVDDAQLRHLRSMSTLRVLDLASTAVTDTGLLHLQDLSELEDLQLWGTGVTDAGCRILGRLQGLRTLGLGATRITDAGLAAIAELPDLRVLQLWATEVQGPGLEHLHRMRSLEVVTLPWRVRGRSRRLLRNALPRTSVA